MAPTPHINRSHKWQSPNRGGRRTPEAIVWHIADGSLDGTLSWLTSPESQASSNYVVSREGVIFELVPPDVTPWTNGLICKPDLASPLVKRWVDAGTYPNEPTITIECIGYSSKRAGGSLAEPQVASLVILTAWLCQEHGIPPDRQHILGHYQIDACNRWNCPGFSAAEWQQWVARVAAMLADAPAPGPRPFAAAYRDGRARALAFSGIWRDYRRSA